MGKDAMTLQLDISDDRVLDPVAVERTIREITNCVVMWRSAPPETCPKTTRSSTMSAVTNAECGETATWRRDEEGWPR
jgi:hypothetical protein